jgi:hypothetical protein
MEDGSKMKENLNTFKNGRRPAFFSNGRRTPFFQKKTSKPKLILGLANLS